jgi:hypothetical protein
MPTPPPRLDELITFVRHQTPDGGPLEHLSTAVLASEHLGEVADHLIGFFVDRARSSGASWTDIGHSMGVTKQAAQQRFVPRTDDARDTPGSEFWARFTEHARQVVVRAEHEARDAKHNSVGTEHLLLAMLADPDSPTCAAIAAQVTSLDTVREATRRALGPAQEPLAGHLPFTARMKKLREVTVREALRLGHDHVGTEHMLLALLTDGDAVGAKVLLDLGVTRDATESWILAAIDDLRRPDARQ